jgi:hypothetical protein
MMKQPGVFSIVARLGVDDNRTHSLSYRRKHVLALRAQAAKDVAAYIDLGATFDPDYASYRRLLHTARLLVVEGTVQRESSVINLLATQIAPLEQQII